MTKSDDTQGMTLDDLAAMMQRGFSEAEERNEQRHNSLRNELKGDIQSFREEVNERFEETGSRFDSVDKKLDSTIDRTDLSEEYLDVVGKKLELPTLAEFARSRSPLDNPTERTV